MEKNCIQCKKPFIKNKKISKTQWQEQRFCSKRCFSESLKVSRTVSFICEECGDKVERRFRADYANRFCSNICSGKAGIRLATKGRDFRGEKNPAYKNGVTITKQGYRRLNTKEDVLEHRYVMEEYLGRKLTEKECIHHKDGNKLNNSIDNLQLCKNQSEHIKIHAQNPKWGLSVEGHGSE